MTRLDSCQYLLVSQINDTLTNFADHCEQCRHDAITRDLRSERITPRLVWENVRDHGGLTPRGALLVADTVLDTNDAFAIARVRSQSSGNATAVIQGLGVVTCVYGNPNTDQCGSMDSRRYAPAGEGTSKRDQGREMLPKVVYQQQLPVHAVLLETGDAPTDLMVCMAALDTRDDCPRKDNRHGADTSGTHASQRVDAVDWRADDLAHGTRSTMQGGPKDYKVHRFRVAVSPHRTDSVVPNDQAQDATEATREGGGVRWKIEPWHRAGKQGTGLERCQCRQARLQRHQIGCAFLVWVRRKALAAHTGRTGSQLKQGLLDDSLIQQLRNPSFRIILA